MNPNQERDDEGLLPKGKGYKNLTGTSYCYKVGKTSIRLVDRISGHGHDYSLLEMFTDHDIQYAILNDRNFQVTVTPQVIRNTILERFNKVVAEKSKKKR